MTKTEPKFARTCSYAVLILALAIGVVAVATNNSLVSAQVCTAQLGTPTTTNQQYYGSNLQVTVPVSTSCSYYTPQLFATGTAYDTTYNSNIGTANTVLSVVYGGYGSSGQLQFNLPVSGVASSAVLSFNLWFATRILATVLWFCPNHGIRNVRDWSQLPE